MVKDNNDKNIYGSCKISSTLLNGIRLESSVYLIENILNDSKSNNFETCNLGDNNYFVEKIFYPGRFTRNYLPKNSKFSIGFIGSAEMLDIHPKPQKFLPISLKNIDSYRVDRGDLLLSRSGTIGKVTLVGNQLKNFLISEHAIRVKCKKFPGYIYTVLKSDYGQKQLLSKIYGAVVDQIEPEHLTEIKIPIFSEEIIKKIDLLILESFKKRDESNALLEEAEKLLLKELELESLDSLESSLNVLNSSAKIFSIKLLKTNLRFEASYNLPIIDLIIDKLQKNSKILEKMSNFSITQEIIQPSRFKRVYVDEKNGVKFIGGKELGQLVPSTEKYLSKSIFNQKIQNELLIRRKSIIITSRGSLGKTILTPDYFENWAISDNLIQVIPASENIGGYLFVFLSSEFGKILMTRYNYGGVIDVLEKEHLAEIPIPILKNEYIQKIINDKAIQAISFRNEAYYLEKEAFDLFNECFL